MTFSPDTISPDGFAHLAALQTLAGHGLVALGALTGAARRPAPLPPPMPALPRPAVRARGVYLDDDAPAGYVVILVYDRFGRRISRAELMADVYTAECFDCFWAWLDLVDPAPGAHAEAHEPHDGDGAGLRLIG